jgi:hypothetical protein
MVRRWDATVCSFGYITFDVLVSIYVTIFKRQLTYSFGWLERTELEM